MPYIIWFVPVGMARCPYEHPVTASLATLIHLWPILFRTRLHSNNRQLEIL